MTRRIWMVTDALLVLAALLAGWFAANAPEVARPALSAFGVVSMPEEAPELPPAPFTRRASDAAAALARRPLFTAKPGAAGSGARPGPPPRPSGEPMARTVLEPPTEPPKLFVALPPGERVVNDPFRAALQPPKPRHEQYFGGHLIPPRNLDPDGEALAAPDGNAPAQALAPRINPSRPEGRSAAPAVARPQAPVAAAPVEAAPPPVAAVAAPPAVEEAAAPAAIAPAGDAGAPADDMLLLGVFQSRGAERALVRTAAGNVRVRPGDEIDGWRVAAIGENNVRLRRGSQTRLLEMPKPPQ